MKLKQTALANTLGVLGAGYYVICYVLVLIAPDVYQGISQSWAHGVDLSSIWKPSPDGFFLGIVTFTASSWITGWLGAWIYNRFVK